jgi:hypothetical protein
VLYGDDWSRFMARSKYTIGVEGGASILDHDGSLRARVYDYELDHPHASFAEVEAACFPGRDGELKLFAVSPRHLEACVSRTCQVLVRGEYNGVLEAGRHYIPVEPDFSNLDDVLETMRRDDRRHAISEAAFEDVVRGGRWTYRGFVAEVEAVAPPGASPDNPRAFAAARAQDRASWWFVALLMRVAMPVWLKLLAAIPGPVARPLKRLAMARAQRRAASSSG